MNRAFDKLFITIIFSFIVTIAFSQTKEIQIKFLGNCGLYMTDGDSNLYIDFPYKSGAYGYMEFDESALDNINENAIFIFTHKHADHYSKKNLKKVTKLKENKVFGVGNINELGQLSKSIEDFDIKAFKTKHTFFGIPFRHYSYLITWHQKRIYISGDTTNPETIGEVKNIDLAFVPYWIIVNAKAQNIEIDAKNIAVYHLYPSEIQGAKEKWDKVDNIRPMIEQGQILVLEP